MRAELEILGLDASRHVVDTYAEFLDALGVDPQPRPADPAQPVRAAGRRGQGRHPDPADPVRPPGGVPDPRRRAPGRSTRRSSRTPRAPTPPPSSTPGCWWCAASCAAPAAAASPCGPPAAGSCPSCTRSGSPARRRVEAVRELMAVRARGFDGGQPPPRPVHAGGFRRSPYADGQAAGRRRRGRRPAAAAPAAWARRVLVHSSGVQRCRRYADIKPAGEDPDHGDVGSQAVAPQPRERRMTAAAALADDGP